METIAVDLMGGDKAPGPVIGGVLQAVASGDIAIALLGTKEGLAEYERAAKGRPGTNRVTPYEASEVVTMEDSPADAYRLKKDSTIAVGIGLVKEGKADGFVSAGNSGAVAAQSLFTLGRLEGIDRPAIATLYRNQTGKLSLILDIGANVDCRPPFLLQFGQMGSDFMSKVIGVQSPRVALLSNGEEDTKGTKLVKDARKLLKESSLNFIGNVEGFDLVTGDADVIVTDGFTGNVVLKLAEGLTTSVFMSLKDALGANPLAKFTKIIWGPPMKAVAKRWYQNNIGGAPLLGVKGNIIISHGRAEAGEIKGAISLARQMVQGGWIAAPGATSSPKIAVSLEKNY